MNTRGNGLWDELRKWWSKINVKVGSKINYNLIPKVAGTLFPGFGLCNCSHADAFLQIHTLLSNGSFTSEVEYKKEKNTYRSKGNECED